MGNLCPNCQHNITEEEEEEDLVSSGAVGWLSLTTANGQLICDLLVPLPPPDLCVPPPGPPPPGTTINMPILPPEVHIQQGPRARDSLKDEIMQFCRKEG